jgi:hypothetical protein
LAAKIISHSQRLEETLRSDFNRSPLTARARGKKGKNNVARPGGIGYPGIVSEKKPIVVTIQLIYEAFFAGPALT